MARFLLVHQDTEREAQFRFAIEYKEYLNSMLSLLSKFVRPKTHELEAELHPMPGCTYGGVGEIEIEAWSDGATSVEVSLKHSSIPNGTPVEFYCQGMFIAVLNSMGGYAKQEFRQPAGSFPNVEPGDEAEIRIQGQTLYSGLFRQD